MFKNILVPLDGSVFGETALHYAGALAGRTGASLTLIRTAQIPVIADASGAMNARVIAEAENYLAARAAELTADGFTVDTGVPFAGSPATWIAAEVGLRHADLIVMATHDRSGPNRWLHGSVAEAVVNQASVPVLLIRVEGEGPIRRFGRPRPEFVVPLDGSALAEAALPVARGLANTLGGHLVLVGVIPTPGQLVIEQGGALGTYVGSDYAQLEANTDQYLNALVSHLTASGLSAEASVRKGQPAAQIGQVADEHDAAAVIMATHGRTGLARVLMGSVAGEVLHRSTSPVMLIRPPTLRPAEVPVRSTVASTGFASARLPSD
jgi:nucleotide-binding universal stress UspA family protein